MPTAASIRKTRSAVTEPSAQSEKPKARASRRKAPTPKTDEAPSQLMEEGPPTITPASPKKRGRKPKRVAAKADDLLTQDMAEDPGTKTADEPTDDTHVGPNLKSKKAPVPTRDPLPAREGRNTHPGLRFGLQPTPCRSSQQVAAEHEQKRQELEARLQAAEVVKQELALMNLEDKRIEEAFEEEGRRRLQFGQSTSSGDEEFEGLDDVDSNEEDSPSPEPKKVVRTHSERCANDYLPSN
jgi:hypothetical protein